jgi:hypothetical protein
MSSPFKSVIRHVSYWWLIRRMPREQRLRDPMEIFDEVFRNHTAAEKNEVLDDEFTEYVQQNLRDARSSDEVDAFVRQLELSDIGSQQWRIQIKRARDRAFWMNHFVPKAVHASIGPMAELPRTPQAIGLLKAFRWFCNRDAREIVDLVLADLTRDVRQLASEGRSRGFIRAVVWRHVGGTLVSITWNAFNSLLKRIGTTLGLIRTISK